MDHRVSTVQTLGKPRCSAQVKGDNVVVGGSEDSAAVAGGTRAAVIPSEFLRAGLLHESLATSGEGFTKRSQSRRQITGLEDRRGPGF